MSDPLALRRLLQWGRVTAFCTLVSVRGTELINAVGPDSLGLRVGCGWLHRRSLILGLVESLLGLRVGCGWLHRRSLILGLVESLLGGLQPSHQGPGDDLLPRCS